LRRQIHIAMITLFILVFLGLIDFAVYQVIRFAFSQKPTNKSFLLRIHIYLSIFALLVLIIYRIFLGGELIPIFLRQGLAIFLLIIYFTKIFTLLGLGIGYLLRLPRRIFFLLIPSLKPIPKVESIPNKINRATFLKTTVGFAGAVSTGLGVYGITTGLYDYQIKRVRILLPNLPDSFDGIRIAQISDIHSGSLLNKKAVLGGIEMLLKEKTDLIFFTGDLVNYATAEVHDWVNVFQKIKAPLGTFSSLGNHDYGDYRSWESGQAKAKNLQDMLKAHRNIGWDLLIDEHRYLTINGDKIALLGVGNWGTKGRFPQYGRLDKASKGINDVPVKLLLSHDPSHWDAQVRTMCPDIDVTFAGHTHGMQVGVDWGGVRWSPVQYFYEQWGGLYQKQNQYIYVNRGFGYSEMMPVRLGMLPEITIIELKKRGIA
jgi:uncharacterized protein